MGRYFFEKKMIFSPFSQTSPFLKIGIFGGSFNPPHLAHFQGLEKLLTQQKLDKILISPSSNPFKQREDYLPINLRTAMIEAAFQPLIKCQNQQQNAKTQLLFDWFEAYQPQPTYTEDLLQRYRNAYGEKHEFFLILGADLLSEIFHWRGLNTWSKEIQWIILRRLGEKEETYPTQIPEVLQPYLLKAQFLNFHLPRMESKKIREKLFQPYTPALEEELSTFLPVGALKIWQKWSQGLLV